jgi:hypothetical protein
MNTVQDIRAAAAKCEGIGNKVFVAEVARELGVSLASIAPTLLAAHRSGELPMSRWDLAQAMHETVDQSAIIDHFHVVRLDRDVRQMPKTHGDYGLSYYSRDAACVAPRAAASRAPSKRERLEQAYEAWRAACAEHGEDSPEAAAAWANVAALS